MLPIVIIFPFLFLRSVENSNYIIIMELKICFIDVSNWDGYGFISKYKFSKRHTVIPKQYAGKC